MAEVCLLLDKKLYFGIQVFLS